VLLGSPLTLFELAPFIRVQLRAAHLLCALRLVFCSTFFGEVLGIALGCIVVLLGFK
jgi:hypothetical protein